MARHFFKRWLHKLLTSSPRRRRRPWLIVEPLEQRVLLDSALGASLPPALVVGRTLSSYFVGGVQNNQETITYTVYNEQANPETGVLLTDTLQPGVTFQSASQLPDQSGQKLAWSLGTIQGFDRASLTLTVSLPSAIPLQLDTGAQAFAMLDGGAVSNTTPAATLRSGQVSDPSLLASTPDANTTDPYVQEEAAKLTYDPQQIFDFLHNDIGYNSYLGSLRGARGTLWSSAGNALDVASLGVALMRASGIPAQYVSGTLSQSQAQQLILSMFPPSYQTVDYIPPGTPTADPANDPQLLAETENHAWFQFDTGGGMQDADPLMTGTVGQAVAASTESFSVVPDSLREKTEVSLTTEIYSQASAAFGTGDGLTQTLVLDHTFNDVDLVGRPLTLGNFVSIQGGGLLVTTVTNTYTPYLALGDYAFPDATQDEVITGASYQEQLTSLPLGSQILTGLFLNMTQSGPNGPAESYGRTLLDRIGFAVRQNGASFSVSMPAKDAPAVTPTDVLTVSVDSATPPMAALAAELGQWQSIHDQMAALAPALGNITVQAPESSDQAVIQQATQLLHDFYVAYTRALAVSFTESSDQSTRQITTPELITAYFARPRITLTSTTLQPNASGTAGTIKVSIDLRKDNIRVVAASGQAARATFVFNEQRGLRESLDEQQTGAAFPLAASSTVPSVGVPAIFLAAQAQGIPVVHIDPAHRSLLDGLAISAEAKARISLALSQGKVVIVPAVGVPVDGTARIAWYELNPSSGELVAVTEDGGHQDIVLYVEVLAIIGVVILGFLTSLAPPAPPLVLSREPEISPSDISEQIFNQDLEALDLGDPPIGSLLYFPHLPPLQPPNESQQGINVISAVPPGTVQGAFQSASVQESGELHAEWTTGALSTLQVTFLNSSSASVTDKQGSPVGSGSVALSVASAAPANISGSITYDVNGNGSLSFYGAAENNLGVSGDWTNYTASVTGNVTVTLTTDSLTLNGQALPAGTYTITAASATVAGNGQTTSPNFAGSASITATGGVVDLGAGSGSLTVGGNAVSPANGVTLTGYTGSIAVAAGGGNNTDAATLTGNAENVVTVSATPGTVTTDQNTPATFQANVNSSLADTYNLFAQAPPGWTVSIDPSGNVTVTPAPGLQGGVFPVQLIAQSSTNPALIAQTTVSVTVTPTLPGITLNVNPDRVFSVPVNGAQLPTSFRADIHNTGPSADTYNLTFANVPAGFTVLDNSTSVTVPAGQTGIVGFYLQPTGQIPAAGPLSFDVTATSASNGSISQTQAVNFTLPALDATTLTDNPTTLNTTPATPVTDTLTVQNVGNVAENVALSASNPTGLTLTGLPAVVPLGIGQSANQTITLTPAAGTPLNTTLTATLSYAPALPQDVVSVIQVAPTPSSVEAGQSVDVAATVFAGVSQPRTALVSYTVKNAAGTVLFTSTPVPVQLSSVAATTALDLGSLDTTGFAPGADTIDVTVTEQNGQPIAGATGQGTLLIHSILTASLTLDSNSTSPGNATVTDTLEIDSNVPGPGIVSTTAVPGAGGVAQNGNLLYVSASDGIRVYDITNPSAPQLLHTVGQSAAVLRVHGNELIALQGVSSFVVSIYLLADPTNPQLLGSTSPIPYYNLAQQLIVTANHVFVPVLEPVFYLSNNDIFTQDGDLISIDISNPAAPHLDGVLFNTHGTDNDGIDVVGGVDLSGGNIAIWSAVQVNATTLLVASTTATGGNTQDGVGCIDVVDISDPTHMSIVGHLDIPGTLQVTGIEIEGNQALVTASTGGWQDFFTGGGGSTDTYGLTGNVVLATVDITDPLNPQLLHTQTLNRGSRSDPVLESRFTSLGGNLFAFSNLGAVGEQPQLLVFNNADPTNPGVSSLTVPSDIADLAGSNNLIYTTSANGLIIYRLTTPPVAQVPVTAQVQIPKNTGVAVVPNSFSLAPTQIIDGPTFQTLVWGLSLGPNDSQTITWQSALTNLQPGEIRPVTLDTTVQQGMASSFTLPPLEVAVVPPVQTLEIPVQIVVPGAAAIANAAVAAGQLGDTDLANRLNDLSLALTNLVQNPTSTIYQSQALASLDAVIGLLSADPFLAAVTPALTTDRAALAQATTAAGVQAALSALGNDLGLVAATLGDEAAHNFTLSLLNNDQVAQPQTPTPFQIDLQNTGTQTTTYDLSVSGVPAGVTVQLSQSSITLAPGQGTPGTAGLPALSVTLTSTSAMQLPTFSFQVTATAEGAPEITQTTTGAFTARAELVSVNSVSTNPPFTNPGGQVDVSARILNAVNRQQQAQVSYTATDPSGNVVFTSPPVTTTLTVLATLTTVDLGNLDTTGFALGEYTITVTVADASGKPIPGATGLGTLLVGSPVTASLSSSPETLPAGNGTFSNTLQVASQIPAVGSFSVVGQAPVPNAGGVVQNGNLLYVGAGDGIRVYDVTDPTAPHLLNTVGQNASVLRVSGNELIALQNSVSSFVVSVYSLATPTIPLLLGSTPAIPYYNLATEMVVTGTHVFVPVLDVVFFFGSDQIFAPTGDLISVDISNPAAPQMDGVLLNTHGTDDDGKDVVGGADLSGGDFNMWSAVQVDPTTLLVASTTATGGDTQTGVGRINVVDISDPTHMSIVGHLDIPGTVQVTGIELLGNEALVTASTGGWQQNFSGGGGPTDTYGLTGDVVLATLDITAPRNPQLLHTQTVNQGSRSNPVLESRFASLGGGLFAFSDLGLVGTQPQLLVINAGNPVNLGTGSTTVPSDVTDLTGSNNLVYTTSPDGLIIYQVSAPPPGLITAQVTVPTNNGVAIVPNSFNVAPTKITPGAGSETLEWDLNLLSGTSQTLTWQSTVTGLQPGEARTVAQGATVSFTSQGTPGTLTLPPTLVTGEQIIGLSPATQTMAPGAPAAYTVTLANLTNASVTYNLSVQGVPASWVNLAATVPVGANGSVTVPLTLTSDAFAPTGDHGFSVTAGDAAGATGSVQGDLVLQGQPAPPDPESHGIVVSLAPASASAGQGTPARYVLQLTNTGSADDTFTLAATGQPSGVSAAFGQATVDVPPGASNFRDVTLTLTPQAGTTAGSDPFTVTATSTSKASINGTANGTLDVLDNGVGVTLNPPSGAPGSGFQMTVTNTGQVTDTFDLALAGPAAVVASLGTTKVTLSPGASQVVSIATGAVNFAVPGPLPLTATATSEGNPAVQAGAPASLTIPTMQGLTAQLTPATQTLATPGTASFLLQVNNTGNTEDSYTATITGTSGPVTASLLGLDGQPTQSIPLFRLPGLSSGAILIQTNLASAGQGMVQVMVQSLSSAHLAAPATATVIAAAQGAVLMLAPPTLPSGEINQPYQQTFTTSGGTGAVTFAVSQGSLPGGLMLAPATGVLAGMPTTAGLFAFTVTATDAARDHAALPYSVTITHAPAITQAPAITSGNGATFTVEAFGSFTVTATGVPTAALSAIGALPSGVTFVDNGNGTATLSGMPAVGTQGIYVLTLTAANGLTPNAVQTFTLRVGRLETLLGQYQQTGLWFVSQSVGDPAHSPGPAEGWAPSITWADVNTGDFNGDGFTDFVGRDVQTGQWFVALSNGHNQFTTTLWDAWSPSVTWADVKVGDLTGDGKDDLIGRDLQNGQWWAAVSTGSSFRTSLWDTWNPNVTWVDVQLGDLTGDGKADLVGRVLQTGQWWVGVSTGSALVTSLWDVWSPAVTWVDVQLGDFNGDGKLDLVGRVLQSGQWWVGLSTGSSFATSLWDAWSTAYTWVDVKVGDLNGDGKADIIGRALENGQWWAGLSTGSSFATSYWDTWSTAVTWVDVQIGDFNGDGLMDIVGRALENGQWWVGVSTGAALATRLWDRWDTTPNWVNVHDGIYG